MVLTPPSSLQQRLEMEILAENTEQRGRWDVILVPQAFPSGHSSGQVSVGQWMRLGGENHSTPLCSCSHLASACSLLCPCGISDGSTLIAEGFYVL